MSTTRTDLAARRARTSSSERVGIRCCLYIVDCLACTLFAVMPGQSGETSAGFPGPTNNKLTGSRLFEIPGSQTSNDVLSRRPPGRGPRRITVRPHGQTNLEGSCLSPIAKRTVSTSMVAVALVARAEVLPSDFVTRSFSIMDHLGHAALGIRNERFRRRQKPEREARRCRSGRFVREVRKMLRNHLFGRDVLPRCRTARPYAF